MSELPKISFLLPLSTFSLNSMFYNTRSIKKPEARDWESLVFYQLNSEEIQQKFDQIKNVFDPTKHVYNVELIAYYPKQKLITSKGVLSSKVHDLSNWEKPLIDLIFLSKYNNNNPPNGCKNLNSDDRYISKLTSSKMSSNKHAIRVSISIEKIDEILDPHLFE